jgi:acetoin utilization deacetylase AcuC-like enzyme
MKVYYSDHLLSSLPGSFFFPASRYGLLYHRVRQSNFPGVELFAATQASADQILAVHKEEYFLKISQGTLTDREMRRIGLPWSPELFSRTLFATGGTISACRSALQDGIACNLAGGAHHAYPDHGEGYCVFNDVAVAVRAMQNEGMANRIVVLDCDVHQGNGTASIFSADPNVFTFSVHGTKNFPFRKEIGSLDIALPDGSGDEVFLDAVRKGVPIAIEEAQAELAIYVAGADPYIGDRLGRLAMTKEGLAERDRWVIQYCLSMKLPVAVVMGGGYAWQVEDVVDIHVQTIRIAAELASQHGL